MTTDYVHRAVEGLPASLLEHEGSTFAVISMMQRKGGLNRDVRRELANDVNIHTDTNGAKGDKHAKSEMNLLAYYLSSTVRFDCFWRAAQRMENGRGGRLPKTFALAVDLPLLQAYAPEWMQATFDENVLVPACPEWARVKQRICERLKQDTISFPLQALMVWPGLLKDLGRWDELDEERRRAVGLAVFSMSSITLSDWFIREALQRCPALSSELGELLDHKLVDAGSDASQSRAKGEETTVVAESTEAKWVALVHKLDALGAVLRQRPTRKGVADLAQLSDEFNQLLPQLPDEDSESLAACQAQIDSLLDSCRQLGQQRLFTWLNEALVDQIAARWRIALRGYAAGGYSELAKEVKAAGGRGASACDRYRIGVDACTALAIQVAAVQEELESVRTLAEQRVLARRKSMLQMDELNASAALPTLQDEILAAWSPNAAMFDHGVDYTAELASCESGGETVVPEDDAPGGPGPTEVGHTIESPEGDRVALLTIGSQESLSVNPNRAAAGVAENSAPTTDPDTSTDEAVADRTLTILSPKPTAASDEGTGGPEQVADFAPTQSIPQRVEDFSTEAGDRCRPIWRLMKAGELSLAYQLARALESQADAPRVPYTALLASVTLASQLVLPDGGVQEALGDEVVKLDADWFSVDEPHDWHAAMNLLLVAATLRPMIFAPSTGASSIAGYLHLDSRFAAIYALVQRLRHFSDRLQGFRIEPATLKLARSEAALQEDMHALQAEANDWLRVQAPAVTIKFAAATKVWQQWVKPQGIISQLVSPVVSNRQGDVQRVKELIATLADIDDFSKLVRDTDRRENKRRNGEDIYAGAMDHLVRCSVDAITLARRWVTLVDASSQTGDWMRTLLQEVRAELAQRRQAIEVELGRSYDNDDWGLVNASQTVALAEFHAVWNLFDPAAQLPPTEAPPQEVLGQGLLLVPSIRVGDDWNIASDGIKVSKAIAELADQVPIDRRKSFELRLSAGDLHGAERLAQRCEDPTVAEIWLSEIRRDLEGWRAALRRAIEESRREVEVGLAYGYLTEAERSSKESRLVQWEANWDEIRRFDEAIVDVNAIRQAVQASLDEKTTAVRKRLLHISRSPDNEAGAAAVSRVLEQGDIATANELLQRLVGGLPAWPEEEQVTDRFSDFFPLAVQALEGLLASRPRESIESAIRNGQSMPGLDFHGVAGAQREQAMTMHAAWSDLKSRKQAEAGRLQTLLTGLGMGVQHLARTEKVGGREYWELDATRIEDRNICAIPQYGSSARGRYRLVCVWEHPTGDDIVQLVGESTLQRATIVLYFGRMTEVKWRDTSRLAKSKCRSFLIVDEAMLTYLCAEAGSRLAAMFDLALPFSYSIPYDATAGLVPPEMFYGRSAELDAVRGLNGRCFIYGGRQLGKTALLRRAEQSFHSPTAQRFSRWIDLRAEGIGVNKTPGDIWVCLTEQLKSIGVFRESAVIPNPTKRGSVDKVLAALREFLGSDSDRRILLLLDEADRFFEQDGRNDFAETRRLKQLMDETGRRFKVVFAGLHNVLRMTERANHPLAHFGEPIKIGPLVDEHEVREAEELIRKPLAAAGFALESRSLAIRVLAQTNYYPSLIQLYCSHLLRHMLNRVTGPQKPIGPRYVVTNRDVDSVYSSGALRDEIRAKFRLTLELDPRYEVVAYALAHDVLRGRYEHGEGMDWQSIRQAGAMYWWPEGFRETTELDFRVLLDEMVELGVLSRIGDVRYTLRNPNVLLLLGTLSEIEAVLEKSREPALEFESAVFRAPRRSDSTSLYRSPLTYQQLSELLPHSNNVTVLAGTEAGGVSDVVPALQDYLGQAGDVIALEECPDRHSFIQTFDRALKARDKDTTLLVVPPTAPWSAVWVREAREKLVRLSSESKFVSVLFVANPAGLWGEMDDDTTFAAMDVPWMSLLPWHDSFVRQWLQNLHLPSDIDVRKSLSSLTGYWPALLYDLVKGCSGAADLRARINATIAVKDDPERCNRCLRAFGLEVQRGRVLLETLALYGEPVEPSDLAVIAEARLDIVQRTLRWADLLGLARREGGDFWSVDPGVRELLTAVKS